MQVVLERLEAVESEDLSFAQFLESHCQDLPPEVKQLASRYVEGFNAADQTLISAQALREAERAERAIEGDRLFRLVGGYSRVLDWLHAGIAPACFDLRLGAVVSAITWQPGQVQVESHSVTGTPLEPYEAARAVITLPVGVLQSPPGTRGAIRFSPELPEKQAALGRLKMGPVVKLVLRFDQAFWDEGDLDRADFLHLPDEPFPTWWTSLPLRVPILTGWAGGPAADRMSQQDDLAILAEGLSVLSRSLELPRPQLEARLRAWQVCNWQADPFARGAYSYVLVGGMGAVAELARPVADTLYFAGEGTQEGFSGTVASAIASGYRAADHLLRLS
jgi:monoamine oxidase